MRLRLGVSGLVLLFLSGVCRAQAPTAVINGQVRDATGAAIAGAILEVFNDATHVRYLTETNSEGIYSVPDLPPGTYHIQVSKQGFKTVVHPDITLNVQDAKAIGFTLPVGPVTDTVTVEGGVSLVNTESAAVSTVVDQTYVKNMPLNGRSFQDLILLTPGVVTSTSQPQLRRTGAVGVGGEFSVNGQRTESNYYTVDGTSANVGIAPGNVGPGVSGSVASSTALGTTQTLVSVDALEEFRVQSSTYSAEYGRNPGGQFSLVTRSGTNQWHGTAFDYLRNDIFDANDWFNDFFGKAQTALRQNDFGGTLGGPMQIPHLYNGKDKTFFFFSYEALRLIQPQAATPNYVPDAALRVLAPVALQPILNAFPIQNGPELGNGLAEFIGTWSNPSQVDSTSVRLDHTVSEKLKLFFRFGNTPSSSAVRGSTSLGLGLAPSSLTTSNYTARTYTVGASSLFTSHLNNEFRLNYSSNEVTSSQRIDSFGGGQGVDFVELAGLNRSTSPSYFIDVLLRFPGFRTGLSQAYVTGSQSQWNLVDSVGFAFGRHQLKAGIDYRHLAPVQKAQSPEDDYLYFSQASVQSNSSLAIATANGAAYPVYSNFSAFSQDQWRLTPRLALSLGLRWEINPAPTATQGNMPYTVQGSSLSTLMLAPQGTPLWKTTWFNFAPRLGAAYLLRNSAGWETVLRGGGGVFFDTGQQAGSSGYSAGVGFFAFNFYNAAGFPLSPAQASPPIVNPPMAPYGEVNAFPAHLQLPYTLQTNLSIEQALGKSQALTVSYVGAFGRKLLELNERNVHAFNPNFTSLFLFQNGLTSNYNALQLQLQRRFAHGLQALASYTWSHSIDYGSYDISFPYARGNSDYDVRHNVSGALSYDLPTPFRNGLARLTLHHWGLDSRFDARTGFPVTLNGNTVTDPTTGRIFSSGLNLVPGQPLYLYGQQFPGGREINPLAFSLPPGCTAFFCPPGTPPGNAPRNLARGFGSWQADLAVRREFPIYERLKLQFRAEAFNLFNHPNFGTINATYCTPRPGCTFGQTTATLAQSLGVLSPLYQMGGARSMQFALKLLF